MNEQDLRTLLHGAAAGPPAAVLDDDAATDAVVGASRARRRQRLGLAAVGVAAALVAVGVPVLSGADRAPEQQVAAPPAPAPPDWPVRGSLADDPAAVEAARRLPWAGWSSTSPVADREVLFLGDVADGRWALVVGRTGDEVVGQWFTGPAGADPAALVADGAVQWAAGVTSLAHTRAGGSAVVLADPGTRVEVSPGVVAGADGSVRRDFAETATDDGVAVVPVGGSGAYGTGAVYRVLRGDEVVGEGLLPVPSGTGEVSDPPVLVPRDPAGEPPAPEAVDHALGAVLARTGLREEDVRPDLLWSGPVPGDAGESPDAVVLAVTLPSGAVAVSVAWADVEPSGAGSAGSCGAQVHPAGTPLDGLAVAAECLFPTRGFAHEPVLLVYAAPGAGRVEVQDTEGTPVPATAGGSGAITVTPAPGRGVLRVERPGAPVTELAVVPAGDVLVDRAGRSAED